MSESKLKKVGRSVGARGVALGFLVILPVAYLHDRCAADTDLEVEDADESFKEACAKCFQVLVSGPRY